MPVLDLLRRLDDLVHEITEVKHEAEAFAGRSDPFLNCFSGVASFAELEELSPAALLISYLQHKEPDRPNDGGPAFPRRTRSTIGAIAEDDTTLHVVYRLWTDAGAYGLTDSVELMSVSRTANKWMIMLNRDLLQMGYAIIERDTVEP